MGKDERSPEPPQDARSNIKLLGLVSLLNDASSEIIQPILPLFISSLGGGGVAIGLIGGLSDGIPSILKIFSGYWADKMGKKKPLVVAGYGLSALSKLLFPLSMIWQQVFILRGLERCGKGIRSAPRDAIIADSATKESRGRGFGILRAMDSTGAVIGSALAYLLWRVGLDFRMIFVIAALLAVLSFVPLLKVKDIIRDPQAGLTLRLSLSSLSPEMKQFMIIASLFALANISYMFFILRAQQFFSGSLAIGAPLLLYILFNVFYAGFAVPSGIISDRVGRKNVLTAGYALFVVVCMGFSIVSSWLGLAAVFMLYGLVFAMVDGAQSAFVSDLSRSESRGSALGVYYGAVGFASIFSGVIAGMLWQSQGAQMTFMALRCFMWVN
ncbi:MAG: MFS transporter [Methanothrix sp.]|nr:MFS transporter [Methanothrix sp.]